MSITNLKLIAEVLIKERLDKIVSGEIRLNVANQHDEYVLESALNVLQTDETAVEFAFEGLENANVENLPTMELAYRLSVFHPESLSTAWTD